MDTIHVVIETEASVQHLKNRPFYWVQLNQRVRFGTKMVATVMFSFQTHFLAPLGCSLSFCRYLRVSSAFLFTFHIFMTACLRQSSAFRAGDLVNEEVGREEVSPATGTVCVVLRSPGRHGYVIGRISHPPGIFQSLMHRQIKGDVRDDIESAGPSWARCP